MKYKIEKKVFKKIDKKTNDVTITNMDDIICPMCSNILEKKYKQFKDDERPVYVGLKCKCGYSKRRSETLETQMIRQLKNYQNHE